MKKKKKIDKTSVRYQSDDGSHKEVRWSLNQEFRCNEGKKKKKRKKKTHLKKKSKERSCARAVLTGRYIINRSR